MQTFLPYPSFIKSAQCLDYKRLGKQRVEARQIYDTITQNKSAWKNHPCTRMWKEYTNALALYHNIIIQEWMDRGYKNNMTLLEITDNKIEMPIWLGLKGFHESHRSNLLRKDYDFYGKYGWTEPTNLPYYWPIS